MSSLSAKPTRRINFPRAPARPSDSTQTVEFVGTLYSVNLNTHTCRIREQLGRSVLVAIGEHLDDQSVGRSMLGEVVRVTAVQTDTGDSAIRRFAMTSIERVRTPQATEYYTWDLEEALKGVEPLRSIEDLAIPGLGGDESDAFWRAVNE